MMVVQMPRCLDGFIMKRLLIVAAVLLTTFVRPPESRAEKAPEPGLLFQLSGNNGFTADYAHGQAEPVFVENIELIPDGAHGKGFRCPNFAQVFAFRANGNIYAQRGTLAFYFRSREPVGKAPFRIVQFSYADHSSFDMNWLRVDYNGRGYDAFVTDANLAQTRVSAFPETLPGPGDWTHFAVTWDENRGIRFYIDGRLAAKKDTTAVYDAALGLFGTHGYFVNTHFVGWGSTFVRGGDFDEFRIYDHMLDDAEIGRLASGGNAGVQSEFKRDVTRPEYRNEWLLRYGWNRDDLPPRLEWPSTVIRKVEIHDAYDHKQWFWKACDGIRETTWPGVYNRSRVLSRNDYFNLPDWNCYTVSGKTVTFTMPDEPWNYLEISGAGFGQLDYLSFDTEKAENRTEPLFERPEDQERTFHELRESVKGGKVRFTNVRQETPLGEFSAFSISQGNPPGGAAELTYTVRADAEPDYPAIDDLLAYIRGRYPADEQSCVVALPNGAPMRKRTETGGKSMPVVHVLIPFEFRTLRPSGRTSGFSYTWESIDSGLDGIAIDLPALDAEPLRGGYFPVNIQVKDPLWPLRSMMDVSVAVKPGEARTLWLDTRDRILPDGCSFLITIAGAGNGLSASSLDGARIRLVFKDRKSAQTEHEADRFVQAKDNLGNIVESNPNNKMLDLYDRFSRDIKDLLRINPDHDPGKYYWKHKNPEQGWPAFVQPEAPDGVPLWAFRQVENMKLVKHFINWWIDNREIENGEFGGGLSDDGDMTPMFPGAALMGIEPEKIKSSVDRIMEAFYADGMFTDGLPTIATDELHVYEDGIQNIPQTMMLNYGNPKAVERLMETARAYEKITGIDNAGRRQITTSFFGGGKFYSEGVWARANTHFSYLILHAGLCLVEFNGHPATKKLILEIADGLLAHRKKDENGVWYLPADIFFPNGEEQGRLSEGRYINYIFWAAYRWTGDKKYLLTIEDDTSRGNYVVLNNLTANTIDILGKRDTWGNDIVKLAAPPGVKTMTFGWGVQTNAFYRYVAWQMTGDKNYLESMYADQIQDHTQRMYLLTEGHWWSDRVDMFSLRELQRARLGGIAMVRVAFYPGQAVSWKFDAPANDESMAILIPDATPEKMTVIAYNLDSIPVSAHMTGWDVAPGRWDIVEGVDDNEDDIADSGIGRRTVEFGKTESLDFMFPPKKTTILSLKRVKKETDYWNRPDLGIGPDDINVEGSKVRVTVHSLGSVDAPASRVSIKDANGAILASADVASLKAPLDFVPKTSDVLITVTDVRRLKGASVVVDPVGGVREITRMNNAVVIR